MPSVGFRHSPESIKRMSESHKGHVVSEDQRKGISERTRGERNPNFGKHHPPEICKMISDAAKRQWENQDSRERTLEGLKKRSDNPEWRYNLSKPKSLIGRENIALANKIKFENPLVREKMSVAAKRRFADKRNHPNYGKPLSEKTKNAISKGSIGKNIPPFSPEHKKRISISNKGQIRSEETKDKMRGGKSHLWKGGITTLYLLIRNCARYYQWRDSVFKRDNYCDWYSGVKGSGNLNAHHIIPFSVLLSKYKIKTIEQAMNCEALWDVNNGVTMFKTSHVAYHSMRGI